MTFIDRRDAGRRLADQLSQYKNQDNVLVLALPRGGGAVACELCKKLNLPLDLLLVRKLGVPGQEELAFGAIAINHIRVLNQNIIDSLRIPDHIIEAVTQREQRELERRDALYRKNKPFPEVKNKTVIIVDDGIATGATMRAAVRVIKAMHPQKIIVAVPIASRDTYEELAAEVNEIIVLEMPEPLYGIGMWYREFPQLTDEEVIELLKRADQEG